MRSAERQFELDVWRFDALVEQARAEPERAGRCAAHRGAGAVPRRAAVRRGVRGQRRAVAPGAGGEAPAGDRCCGSTPSSRRARRASWWPSSSNWSPSIPFEERAVGPADARPVRAPVARRTRSRPTSGRVACSRPSSAWSRASRWRAPAADPRPRPALAAASTRTGAPAESVARRDAGAAAISLPRPVTRLVGRERELDGADGLMADPDVRIITLTGPGGVGKTRLLLELARRQEPDYADGAVFVRLERLTDPALVAAEIATALAQRDGTDGPSADGLAGYLRERELLLGDRQLRAPAGRRGAGRRAAGARPADPRCSSPAGRRCGSAASRSSRSSRWRCPPATATTRWPRARPCSCSCSARWPPTASWRSTPRRRGPWPGSAARSTGCRWRSSSPPPALTLLSPAQIADQLAAAAVDRRARAAGPPRPPADAPGDDPLEL